MPIFIPLICLVANRPGAVPAFRPLSPVDPAVREDVVFA